MGEGEAELELKQLPELIGERDHGREHRRAVAVHLHVHRAGGKQSDLHSPVRDLIQLVADVTDNRCGEAALVHLARGGVRLQSAEA